MRSRRSLRVLAICSLGMVLFVQGAFALATCDFLRAGPSHAIVPAGHEAAELVCGGQAGDANVDLVDSQGEDQGLDNPQSRPSSPMLRPVLTIRLPQPLPTGAGALTRHLAFAAAAPPRILFHSLLI